MGKRHYICSMELTGIILAGGLSKRMGTDKGLVEFRGKQLVQYAIDLISSHCSDIVISANDREYGKFGFPVVSDEIKEIGPAGGIYSALRKTDTDFNLIVSCDMPLLNEDAVDLLLKNVSGISNFIASHKQGIEPLFGIYHKNFLGVLEEAIRQNTYKMRAILDMYSTEYVDFEPLLYRYPMLFRNINYLSDLNI